MVSITQRSILKNRPALRLAVALLLVAFVFASAAHTVASAAQGDFSAQSDGAAAQPDLAITRRSSISEHCRVLDVAVTRTLVSPSTFWPLPRSGNWRRATAITASGGYVFHLFRPPKTLPEQV